ncbi:unnamed protein product, partial [Nesidiocoris tenuis]
MYAPTNQLGKRMASVTWSLSAFQHRRRRREPLISRIPSFSSRDSSLSTPFLIIQCGRFPLGK